MPQLQSVLFLPIVAVGLLAPGWLLGRILRVPAGLTGAFLGSAGILLNLILLLDALNVALTGPHVAGALAATCGILAAVAKWLFPARHNNPAHTPKSCFRWQPHHWFLVPIAIGLGSIMLKASLDPLSGPDTKFRWNFLALQMLGQESLHFYPPVSAHDFTLYDWCDGISPLIASFYFWTYASADHAIPWTTAPIVVGQAVLLFSVVFKLVAHHCGPAAGWCAMAILATSSTLLFGIAMGQETGMTALSLTSLLLFIERYRDQRDRRWLIWAGIAAGIGGLAREYGLAFCLLGGLRLLDRRPSAGDWAVFFGAAFVIAAPWYARNWLKTGNPLFSHNLLGFFPVNPIHSEYIRTIYATLGFTTDPATLVTLAPTIALLGGLPIILGIIGGVKSIRGFWPWLVTFAVIFALWLWSVGQTSGGYVYSLRVLTPALALGAVLAGLLLMRWAKSARSWMLALCLTLPAVDAAERTLFMPYGTSGKWWQERPTAWLEIHQHIERWNRHPGWAAIGDAAAERKILVTDPFTHALFAQLGAKPVSYFSPEVRFLFEPEINYASGCEHLRALGFRFILLQPGAGDGINNRQLLAHPFFATLAKTEPLRGAAPNVDVYDLYSPKIIANTAKGEPSPSPAP